MMDLLHNFSELCYLKVNIIPIVLTNRVLAKCARARASRACAQWNLSTSTALRKQVRERAQALNMDLSVVAQTIIVKRYLLEELFQLGAKPERMRYRSAMFNYNLLQNDSYLRFTETQRICSSSCS